MAKKQLTESQYINFDQEFYQLKKLGNDSLKQSRIDELIDSMEQGLTYVGSTAIEDKLQDRVPEVIVKIIETKIRLWVLTGDKQETAIEIAKSCKLIQPDMKVIILTSSSIDEL